MPAIITTRTRIFNAQQFFEAFSEAASSNLYLFIGKVTPWDDDGDPPIPENTEETERLIWEDMIGGKKIGANNVSHVVRKVEWLTGTVYPRYNDRDEDLFVKDFYVVTDEFNVYKCIDNNQGAASTVKPTGTGTAMITLGDGYTWKFMFTVDTASAVKFATQNWIPVKELLADDGSDQWLVQQTAIDGGLHGIEVTVSGTDYTSAPLVTIEGDGTGATAVAQVSGGEVTRIDITAPGSGYSEATIVLSGGGFTVEAEARAIISPEGGHGSHALNELGGFYVMMNTELIAEEGGLINIVNDFRKIGIMADPLDYGTTTLTTATVFDQTVALQLNTPITGTFLVDELVTGGTSGATARVVEWDATNEILYVNDIDGDFGIENISTVSGSANIDTISDPDLEPRSGQLIWLEYRSPITRAVDQTEQIRVIFEF